jgi:hypothetical protein
MPDRAPHTDAREAWRFCQPSFLPLFFCSRHRVRPFTKGGPLAEFGGEFHAVNIACLDDATVEELALAPIQYVDGRKDDWKSTPVETCHL